VRGVAPWRWELRLPGLRRMDGWAAFGLTGLALILFRQAVFEGRVFFERDIHLNRYGQVQSFVRSLSLGSWPLWDPYVSFGQPMWANPEMQICYPPTWLNFLVPPWTYYTMFVLGHVIFSGLGLHLLARRLGVSPAGCLAAAAIWVCSGPFLSLVNAYHHFAGAAWIPWVLLAAESAARATGWRTALAWGAAVAAQVLAGSADMCLMTGLVAAALVLRHVRWGRGQLATNGRLARSAALALVFALAVSAAQWLPTLELARASARWNLPSATRAFFSVHPAGLLELLLPVSLYELPLREEQRQALFETARQPFLRSVYLGAVALALVAAAIVTRHRGPRVCLAIVGTAAALVSLGSHGVAFDLFSWLLPPLRIVRYPVKAMVVAALAWALLAGMGLDAWRGARRGGSGRWGFGVLVPLAGLGAALGGAVGIALHPEWAGALLWEDDSKGLAELLLPVAKQLAVTTCLALVALGLALARGGRRSAAWLGPAVACLAVLDLGIAHRDLNPTAFEALFTSPPRYLPLIRGMERQRLYVVDYLSTIGKSQRLLGTPNGPRLQRSLTDWPLPVSEALALRLYLYPPVAAAWGVEGSYERDARGLYPVHLDQLTNVAHALEGTPAHLSLLRLGAVGHLITLHTEGFEGLERVATARGLYERPILVFRVPDPLPRTYAVGSARVARGRTAIQTLLDGSFDASRELVLSEGPPRQAGASFSGTSRILELRPDRVLLEAELNEPGYVVLVDAHDPGWRASVDGEKTEVLRANVAFRAVRVPAGRHLVELVYRPTSVVVGLLVSAVAGLLGLIALTMGVLRVPPGALPQGPPGTAGASQ